MKTLFEYSLKLLPLAVIAVISYVLISSGKGTLEEGTKMGLSALLGALISYMFVQYTNFLQRIDEAKRKHSKALHLLEVKLNLQLNWLSDVIFHLNGHVSIVEKTLATKSGIVFDSSSYREPIDIGQELLDVNNFQLKNELLGLSTGYGKINNDVTSMTTGYRTTVDMAVSGNIHMDDYFYNLPSHLEKSKLIKAFAEQGVQKTKEAIASIRVLINDNKNTFSRMRVALIIHENPEKFDSLKKQEMEILENQILEVKTSLATKFEMSKKRLNKSSKKDALKRASS